MTNLIKAEFYRIRHSSHLLLLTIGVCIFGAFMSFLNETTIVTRHTLATIAPIGMIISMMTAGVCIGKHYHNRTAFYEIMDGVSAHRIILSRICVYMPLIACFYFIPVSVFLMYFDFSGESVRFLLMLLIILFRLLVFTICICLTFKTADGAILPYIRFITEFFAINLFADGDWGVAYNSDAFSVLDWMPICQCCLLGTEINTTLIIKIIVGCAVECTIMYALAYTSHRKKWLIKTTLI